MKKFTVIILSMVIVLSTIPVFASDTDKIKDNITSNLQSITKTSRLLGSPESLRTSIAIKSQFESYGYKVTEQTFEDSNTLKEGINVIATKAANVTSKKNPDILILSSHYDTVSGTVGANDNGSGTALLLEVSRILASETSDTEIRFIAFSGEEKGLLGSSAYVNSLSSNEKARIIGDIQLDMIGHYQSQYVKLEGFKPSAHKLKTLMEKAAKSMGVNYKATQNGDMSDHISFSSAEIPSVLITQNNMGIENHKSADNLSTIDVDKIVPICNMLVEFCQQIMKAGGNFTPNINFKSSGYTFSNNTVFYFGEQRALNNAKAGGPGTFLKKSHDELLDWDMEYYKYNARWFGMNKAMKTVFQYRVLDSARYLWQIEIYPGQSGIKKGKMINILTANFGAPDGIYKGKSGSEYIWADVNSQKQYFLTTEKGKTVIQVSDCHIGGGWNIKKYDLTKGQKYYENRKISLMHRRLLNLVYQVIGKDNPYVDYLQIWSDGLSYQLGTSYPTSYKSNNKFTIRMDINDIFDKSGNYINYDKTIGTLVHEYGHALTLNDSQIDYDKKDKDVNYYGPETFLKGSYLYDFYNRFYAGNEYPQDGNSYELYPENFVDEYAASDVNEDIAESFTIFVLASRQSSTTISDQKVNFFYTYPEMVELREQIRSSF